MNTADHWTLTCVIMDPYRRMLWEGVFPGGVMPIKYNLPRLLKFDDGATRACYMLDLGAISAEQREQIIRIVSERFNLRREQIEADMDQGVPILAQQTVVCEEDEDFSHE
jgi:hypothetical protein